jgi:hypothetical protein
VLKVGAIIVGAWFLVTVGVAFLREAKALRRARAALEAGHADRAYNWAAPFVASHQHHVEGLYLAGSSAIKTGRLQEATAHYSKLSSMNGKKAAERIGRLEATYHEQILQDVGELSCGQSHYASYYESCMSLGEKFHDTLVRGASHLTRKCAGSDNPSIANEPGYWLIDEKDLDPEYVVNALYIEPMKSVLEGGRYQLARHLGVQGIGLWSDAEPVVDEVLSRIRSQVAENIEEIQDLCSSVGKDPEHRRGGTPCFPASSPTDVTSRQDVWGNALLYIPSSLNRATQCYGEFKLTSLGVDARQTPDDTSSPAMEFTCRYRWGRSHLQTPERFWLPPG